MGVNDVRSARARIGRWYARGKVDVYEDEDVREVKELKLATTVPRSANVYVWTVRVLV